MFRIKKESEGGSGNPEGSKPGPYSPVQVLFLLRFARLLRQGREYQGVLQPGDWRKRLLDKATYSTYRDCLEENLHDDVEALLERDKILNQKSK